MKTTTPLTKQQKRWLWAVRCSLVLSLVFFAFAAAQAAGFDGLVCRGLNSDLGRVRRDQPVQSTLRLTNLSLRPVTILQEPTCGCQLTKETVLTLPPFHSAALSIPYRIGKKEHGARTRSTLLYVRRGESVRQLTGMVHFQVN